MQQYKVKKDCYCEGYLYESFKYPRPGLKEKKLNEGDVVDFVEEWRNFYGSYIRVTKDGETYDMLHENLIRV